MIYSTFISNNTRSFQSSDGPIVIHGIGFKFRHGIRGRGVGGEVPLAKLFVREEEVGFTRRAHHEIEKTSPRLASANKRHHLIRIRKITIYIKK